MEVKLMENSNKALIELQQLYNIENQYDDSVYQNTKLLLKLYSKVMWRMKNSIMEMNEECFLNSDNNLFNIVDALIDVDPRVDKARIESRLQSIENSKSILVLIDKALILLKNYPKDGERYFEILNKSYLLFYNYNENELLGNLNVSRTTLYREKKKAIMMLGVILWGFVIPDVRKKRIEGA